MNHTSAAISFYKKTLKKKPDWNVARIELAKLHKKKGQTKQALAAYNQVLDNELPYGLRQNLLSLQQALIQKKQNWYMHFLLDSYYDANINKAPKQGQIYIQGYRFDFDEPIAAYVMAPALKVGYQWNLSPHFAWQIHGTQNDIHSYQSPMISLVWERDYKYNIRSTFSGFYGFYQYDGYSTLFQSKRQDHELGIFWDIAKSDWRFFNITPHLKYGNINVFSNQDVFERNQHMFSIYGEIDF